MSRRKQAKPKSTKRTDDETVSYDEEESISRDLIDQSVGEHDLKSTSDIRSDDIGSGLDEEDEQEGSNVSERSTSESPPSPNNNLVRHECGYCDSSFGSFFLLKQHEQENHAHLMPFKCKFCAKGFKHKRSHDRHEKSHSGIRRHKCSHCGQAFFRSDHLKLHLKTHETSKYAFVCTLCQRGFHSSAGLESHIQVHERQKLFKMPMNGSPAAPNCDMAEPTENTQDESEGTASIEFSSDASEPTPRPIPISIGAQSQCSICGAICKTPESLLRHMDSDHRILKPRLESPSPSHLGHKLAPAPLSSMVSTTRDQSTLACSFCQVSGFYSQESLELHLQAVHGLNQTPVGRKWITSLAAYGCGICGQRFSDIGTLQKHTLHAHTLKDLDGGTPDSVNGEAIAKMVSYKATSGTSLVRIATPNNSDPMYDCQFCGKSFDSILALHGHSSSVHGSLPENLATPASLDNGCSSKSPFTVDNEFGNVRIMKKSPTEQQLYQCGQCEDVMFTDLGAFSAHMRQHVQSSRQLSPKSSAVSFQEQAFSCDLCGAQYSNESTRDCHLRKHYLERESQFSCKSCTKTFSIPDELQKHLLDMHAIHLYRCSLCKETFDTRVDIQVHFAVGHSDEIVRFRCRSCNAAFPSEDQFNAHVQVVHLNHATKASDSCSNSSGGEKMEFAGDAIEFTQGVVQVGGQALFCCPLCGDAFAVEYLYEKHLEHAHRAQMEMFMLNEFIPKASVSQLLNQAMKFGSPLYRNSLSEGETSAPNDSGGHSATIWQALTNGSTILSSHPPSNPPSTVIKCNICDRRCESMVELAEHKLQHCKVIHSQSCNFCHEPINSMAEFQSHTRQHNAGHGIPMSCIVCKQSLVSAVDMQTHAKFHLLPTSSSNSESSSNGRTCCGRYDKEAPSSESRICGDNGLDQRQTPNSIFLSTACKCQHCNVKFETAEERDKHECPVLRISTTQVAANTSSRPIKPYQCIKCQKSFATELEIQAHVTTHVLQDGIHHYCMLCKQVFDSPSKLQCHLIEHSFVGCSSYDCYLCNAIFALAQPLQQHMLSKHGVEERPYECPFSYCEQKFFFRAELENHVFLHQPQNSRTPHSADSMANDGSSVSLPIACPTCAGVFPNVAVFNVHSIGCSSSKCRPAISSSSGSLNSESDATEKTAITQPAADLSRGAKQQQQQLGQAKANGNKESVVDGNLYCCPHCTKSFQSLSALQGHSHVHMASKNHQCAKCRKTFPTAAKLRNHQRQHSGDKPFPCTMCMRFFSRKDNLKVHMRIHYKQSGVSPNGTAASPGTECNADSNGDFPTMVPRSHFISSASHVPVASQRSNNSNGEQSSDSSNTPFEFSNAIFGDGDSSVTNGSHHISDER